MHPAPRTILFFERLFRQLECFKNSIEYKFRRTNVLELEHLESKYNRTSDLMVHAAFTVLENHIIYDIGNVPVYYTDYEKEVVDEEQLFLKGHYFRSGVLELYHRFIKPLRFFFSDRGSLDIGLKILYDFAQFDVLKIHEPYEREFYKNRKEFAIEVLELYFWWKKKYLENLYKEGEDSIMLNRLSKLVSQFDAYE